MIPLQLVAAGSRMPPVQRRNSSRLIATRYEDCRLDTERDTKCVNEVDELRMISDRSNDIAVVASIDRTGNAVDLSI